MGRKRRGARLTVALNGRRVGHLDRASNGAVSFAYHSSWLDDERRSIPVSLSLPLREQRYTGAEVSAYFDNLLPDSYPIRSLIAEKVGADGTDAFNLLTKIGRDCVGALQFIRDDADIAPPGPPEGRPVGDDEIANIIRNLAQAPLGIGGDVSDEIRISIAGAQEKTALLWNDGWQVPRGVTPTTHILKPPLGKLPSGLDMRQSIENEHFCLTLCRELGLETASSRIVHFEDVTALSITRFDRLKSKDGRLLRMPQEDFCQALAVPWTKKYASDGGPAIDECMRLLDSSDEPDKDRFAFLKAQIIFWLIGAPDGHAKNFSVFLAPQGRFRMTPLYDVMSVQQQIFASQMNRKQFRLAMPVGNQRHYRIEDVMPRHFFQDATRTQMQEDLIADELERLVADALAGVERATQKMPDGFPGRVAEAIGKGVESRLSRVEAYLTSGT